MKEFFMDMSIKDRFNLMFLYANELIAKTQDAKTVMFWDAVKYRVDTMQKKKKSQANTLAS